MTLALKEKDNYSLLGWNQFLRPTDLALLDAFLTLEGFLSDSDLRRNGLYFNPSYNELQELTSIKSKTTLKKSISNLLEAGLIEQTVDNELHKVEYSTFYRIVRPIPMPMEVRVPSYYIRKYGQEEVTRFIEDYSNQVC